MSGSAGRCARCNGVVEAQDLFCGYCGAPRQAPVAAPRGPESPRSEPEGSAAPGPGEVLRGRRPSRRRVVIAVAALAIAALTIGIVTVLRSTPRVQTVRSPAENAREALVLTNTAQPTGRVYSDGKPEFAWIAYLDLDGSPQTRHEVLGQVSFVRYLLHPSFEGNQVVEVRDGPEAGFPLSTSGWGTFDLTAEVHFQDGAVRVLTHHLRF